MKTEPMASIRATPFLLMLCVACFDEQGESGTTTAVDSPMIVITEAPIHPDPEPIDIQVTDQSDGPNTAYAISPGPSTVQLEGCTEHTQYMDEVCTITLYIAERDLKEQDEAIRAQLISAYQMVEQGAPRSIACDFDHGSSHEQVHMPDTLPVIVKVFERCSAREPHNTRRYAVWRKAPDDWGIELR